MNIFYSILTFLILFTFPFSTYVQAETMAQQTSRDFTQVAKEATPGVVSIKVKSNQQKSSFGDYSDFFNDDFLQQFFGFSRRPESQQVVGQASGFIVSSDGYIMTNGHVVNEMSEITVILNDGREFPAKVIGQDSSTDVALLKIEATGLPYLKFGDSTDLEVGEWAVAIGNPFGLQASLTVGVISAKGRNNLDLANIEDFIQTDAAINRGNSGGPLLNLKGLVIGMNTAIATSGYAGGYVGVGFAIPSNMLENVLQQLKTNGSITRGFMGVSLQSVDADLARAFGLKEIRGAIVADVSRGSPAEQAGIKQGDIIIEYNRHLVKNIAELRNAISLMTPGSKITLTVIRSGKTQEIPVTIGSMPSSTPQIANISGNKLGFEVQNITPEIAQKLNLKEERGVIISKVDPNSVAGWAGLKKGAVVISVNQKPVSNVEQFNLALSEAKSEDSLLLLIKQGEAMRYLSLRSKEKE